MSSARHCRSPSERPSGGASAFGCIARTASARALNSRLRSWLFARMLAASSWVGVAPSVEPSAVDASSAFSARAAFRWRPMFAASAPRSRLIVTAVGGGSTACALPR